MILRILGHDFHYEMENLCRVFFPNDRIQTVFEEAGESDDKLITTRLTNKETDIELTVHVQLGNQEKSKTRFVTITEHDQKDECERQMAIALFEVLTALTGYIPRWGILTGVRPSKLMTNLMKLYGKECARDYFMNDLLVSEEKTDLTIEVALAEEKIIKRSNSKSFSLYVSIPFCPSRCSYCSFVSHSIAGTNAKKLLPSYIEKLCREIESVGAIASELGLHLQTVYFGGGTPTSLDAEALRLVCHAVSANFNLSGLIEYTVEAGRPDTITSEKLKILKDYGISRLSINPQSFNDAVLEAVGRNHSSQCVLDTYELARAAGFDSINMDLIAGLPNDDIESFERTLDITLNLKPENITVHTLALKRSSALVTQGSCILEGKTAAKMIEAAHITLKSNAYMPYYMYRQSRSLGNLENVGWCKPGFEGLYNVLMMEECQTIMAVGAGAVTKLKQPDGNYIERVFNYKYPYEYISRFEEIEIRKNRIKEFYATYK